MRIVISYIKVSETIEVYALSADDTTTISLQYHYSTTIVPLQYHNNSTTIPQIPLQIFQLPSIKIVLVTRCLEDKAPSLTPRYMLVFKQ